MEAVDFLHQEMHVQFLEGEETVSISFSTPHNKEFHCMNRGKDELLPKCLHRLAISCQPKSNNRKSKSKKTKNGAAHCGPPSSPRKPNLVLSYEGSVLDISSMRTIDLQSGMVLRIYTGEVFASHVEGHESSAAIEYLIVKNPPSVTSLSTYPRTEMIVGCAIVPQIELRGADDFECVWCSETTVGSREYVYRSNAKVFQPTTEDADRHLKLFCTPLRFASAEADERSSTVIRGRAAVFYLSGKVVARPVTLNRMLIERRLYNQRQRTVPPTTAEDIANSGFRINQLFGSGIKVALSEDGTTSAAAAVERNDLRCVTYNILAEPFAISENSLNHIYDYVEDKTVLGTEFRIQRILAELIATDADIICLQECDRKTFSLYLLPMLGLLGYTGHYTNKSAGVQEGCATFTRDSVLRVVRTIDVPLKKILRNADYLQEFYKLRPDLIDVIGGKLGTVVQISICERVGSFVDDAAGVTGVTGTAVIVANTHLFWHPHAWYIRLLQLHAITRILEGLQDFLLRNGLRGINDYVVTAEDEVNPISGKMELQTAAALRCRRCCEKLTYSSCEKDISAAVTSTSTAAVESSSGSCQAAIILLGDLNSAPDSTAVEFLTTGSVSADRMSAAWERLQHFWWGDRIGSSDVSDAEQSASDEHNQQQQQLQQKQSREREESDPAGLTDTLCHSLDLISAAGLGSYTNYTKEFKSQLDYIMVQREAFEVTSIAETPSDEVLGEFIGLPSAVFPSDHIAVAVDLTLLRS